MLLEHPEQPRVYRLSHYMTLDVFVAEDGIRINLVNDTLEIIEVRIQFPKGVCSKGMGFGPMRPALMTDNDIFESLE